MAETSTLVSCHATLMSLPQSSPWRQVHELSEDRWQQFIGRRSALRLWSITFTLKEIVRLRYEIGSLKYHHRAAQSMYPAVWARLLRLKRRLAGAWEQERGLRELYANLMRKWDEEDANSGKRTSEEGEVGVVIEDANSGEKTSEEGEAGVVIEEEA